MWLFSLLARSFQISVLQSKMKKLKIKINDLRLAPKCTPDGSYMKVILFMLIVTNFMVAETWATVALGQCISSIAGVKNINLVRYAIYIWQLLSYILSPMLCLKSGRVAEDCSLELAEEKWEQAKPVNLLYPTFYPAGKVLWWGPEGMFIFAPAIWKMQWAGKTIFDLDLVHMLEFSAINRIPTPKCSLPILGNAFLGRDDFEGKTSMAFCYKYLPIIDHLRQIDEKTLIGKMTIGTITVFYFTLNNI